MNKDLLIEYSVFTPTKRRLSEGTANGNGNMIVSGLVQACDKPNANKRIYPYATLRSQVDLYMKGPITENRALGELDHPESSVINLKNVSHNILKLWWEDKNLYGDIEILPTPSGNILKQLFANNITVGISSRAMGTVSPIGEGLVQVEDDLELICWDFVSTPSTFGAYVRPVSGINESYSPSNGNPNKYNRANRMVSDIICSMSGVCCIN
jgi:Prohead core protein serine protease